MNEDSQSDEYFTDSALRQILDFTLIETFKSDVGLVLLPNCDGVGYTARVLSSDSELEFARGGSLDPLDAIQKACARAKENLDNALSEDEDEEAEIEGGE